MKRAFITAAVAAIVSLRVAAQNPQPSIRSEQPTAPTVRMATSHPSTRPGSARSTTVGTDASSPLSVESQNQMVGQYCATCHSERGKAGGLSLAGFDAARIEQNVEV